jgi:creatinine amidohydrolase
MRVAELNWMQLADRASRDDRAVLPIGSTEQHAYLSLATDSILAERVAIDAAAPLDVPVFPVLAYGVTPSFRAYPGSVTLSTEGFVRVVSEILDGLRDGGFRRLLIVNGHGGNHVLHRIAREWPTTRAGTRLRVHDWWKGPRTYAKALAIDPQASHASWMENFPWTRLAGVIPPDTAKPMVNLTGIGEMSPAAARELLGDGSFGGRYARSDEDMAALWSVAVEETRSRLEGSWDEDASRGAAESSAPRPPGP